METVNIERTVRELADREAIRDLASRYAHCIWQGDIDGAIDLFAEDGKMDMDGRAIKGRQALSAAYKAALNGVFHPFVHNHLIELDGDRASGRCCLDLRAILNGKSMIGSGFYVDHYVRTAGKWKFASRKLTMNYLAPVQEGWAGPRPT